MKPGGTGSQSQARSRSAARPRVATQGDADSVREAAVKRPAGDAGMRGGRGPRRPWPCRAGTSGIATSAESRVGVIGRGDARDAEESDAWTPRRGEERAKTPWNGRRAEGAPRRAAQPARGGGAKAVAESVVIGAIRTPSDARRRGSPTRSRRSSPGESRGDLEGTTEGRGRPSAAGREAQPGEKSDAKATRRPGGREPLVIRTRRRSR